MPKPGKQHPKKKDTESWTLDDMQCAHLRKLVSDFKGGQHEFARQVMIIEHPEGKPSDDWPTADHVRNRRRYLADCLCPNAKERQPISGDKLRTYEKVFGLERGDLHSLLFGSVPEGTGKPTTRFKIPDFTGLHQITDETTLKDYRRVLHLYHQCNEEIKNTTYWTYVPIDFSEDREKRGCLYSSFLYPMDGGDAFRCDALGLVFPGWLSISFNCGYWIRENVAHYLYFTKEDQNNRGHWGIIYYDYDDQDRRGNTGASACFLTYKPIAEIESVGRQDRKEGVVLDRHWRELVQDYFGYDAFPVFKLLSGERGS